MPNNFLPIAQADHQNRTSELPLQDPAGKHAGSENIDGLIHQASPTARQLLWLVALANEAVSLRLLTAVWSREETLQIRKLRQTRQLLDNLPNLPAKVRASLRAMPPEVLAVVKALPPAPAEAPAIAPLLRQLCAIGLASEQGTGPADANITCHDPVRERIKIWMEAQPSERGGRSETTVRLAFGDHLAADFRVMRHRDPAAALDAAARALTYFVQVGDYARLGQLTSETDGDGKPRLSQGLLPHMRSAAEAKPEGRPRWVCLGHLADVLADLGQFDASLPFYQQGAALAQAAAETGGTAANQAWADLAWISGNAATFAYHATGDMDAERRNHWQAAAAERQAGFRPAITILTSELEALRIDILQGQMDQALPQVETRLAQVAVWWQRQQAGQPNPEAPDPVELARTYLVGLQIGTTADYAREDWASALHRIDTALSVLRSLGRTAAELVDYRMDRATVLLKLQQHNAAKAELEGCLPLLKHNPARNATALSSIANLSSIQGDFARACAQERRALALREKLPNPTDRAISHINLANYIQPRKSTPPQAEAHQHQLAALLYFLTSGHTEHLPTALHNYAIDFRHAHTTNTKLPVPRIATLLAAKAFRPLATWLRQSAVDLVKLQADVDALLDEVQQRALAGE